MREKKKKEKESEVVSLCRYEMISYRCDIVTSDLTQGDVTFVFNIISDNIGAIGLCEMIRADITVEIDRTTNRCEVVKVV
jgi:hypothetical protein